MTTLVNKPYLTEREKEVLRLASEGFSNKQIADQLVISIRTVEKHNINCYDKLNAINRAQAVAIAIKRGIL